jgi:hypothetical protein
MPIPPIVSCVVQIGSHLESAKLKIIMSDDDISNHRPAESE